MKFISKRRILISSIGAILLEFYAFNFIARNINILATRSLEVKVFDYILNFLLFFIAIYLVATFTIFVVEKIKKI